MNRNFILKELGKSGFIKLTGNNAMILCPFHEDKNPSLGVSLGGKVPCGTWNCLGCGRSGSWNSLASKLGLITINGDGDEKVHVFLGKKIEKQELLHRETLTLYKIPPSFQWRGYNSPLLKKLGAKLMWHDVYSDYYLYLPFYYLGEYHGFVRCKIHSESPGPKYWFNCKSKILYPINYVLNIKKEVKTIVLVEGVADMFRLINNNIFSLAILGGFLTPLQIEILEILTPQKIILCLDGDKAGREAVLGNDGHKGLARLLASLDYDVRVLFPPEGKDPDSMPYNYIRILKKMIL